jgi:CheY-like chemotaxis protein
MGTLSRNSLRLVHVEDDQDFAAISEIFLRHAGFEQPIVRCKDGVEALRYFSALNPKQAPHVVLLDLHLPHLDGLEVLHWLRHGLTLRDIPIYLLTSSDEPEDRRRASADGVTGYLLKSPVLDEVISTLDQLIALINHRTFEKLYPGHHPEDEPFVLVGEDLSFEGQDGFSEGNPEALP